MLPLGELYELIQSLDKSEKRHFKLQIGEKAGKTAYGTLYRLLEAAPAWGSGLKSELSANFTQAQLEIARKHLSKVLTRALGNYHMGTDPEAVLWEKYTQAKLLFKKGLGAASRRHIVQGKEMAQRYNHAHFLGMFCELELAYGATEKFAGWREEEVIAVNESAKSSARDHEAAREHAFLYNLLLCRYWKNGAVQSQRERMQLNDIMLEEHQIMVRQKETFASGKLHLHFQSVFFMMTGDLDGSLKVFYDLDDFFQRHRTEWGREPVDYVRFLQDVLETLRRFGRFEEMRHFEARLEEIAARFQPLRQKITLLLAENRLHVALAQGVDPRQLPMSVLPETGLDKISQQDLLQGWFTLARAHLARKEAGEALRMVNRLLSVSPAALGKMNASKCRMMRLMVHQALQNRDYLHYEIRSVERKMKLEDSWYPAEKLVVDYLKHWLAFRPFNRSRDEILKTLQDPYAQAMVSELGLKNWLKIT